MSIAVHRTYLTKKGKHENLDIEIGSFLDEYRLFSNGYGEYGVDNKVTVSYTDAMLSICLYLVHSWAALRQALQLD